jgi:hypothetical protein
MGRRLTSSATGGVSTTRGPCSNRDCRWSRSSAPIEAHPAFQAPRAAPGREKRERTPRRGIRSDLSDPASTPCRCPHAKARPLCALTLVSLPRVLRLPSAVPARLSFRVPGVARAPARSALGRRGAALRVLQREPAPHSSAERRRELRLGAERWRRHEAEGLEDLERGATCHDSLRGFLGTAMTPSNGRRMGRIRARNGASGRSATPNPASSRAGPRTGRRLAPPS